MKFSIVIPTFNSAAFLETCLESILGQQGPFSLEIIIRDNCSTDETRRVVDSVRRRLDAGHWQGCQGIELRWISAPDRGVYDAVNRGLAEATGDVYAWLGSDDLYLPGALAAVALAFGSHERIRWLSGTIALCTENGVIYRQRPFRGYHREWIRTGIYGTVFYFIGQEGCFWRADLWRRAGGIPDGAHLAGDFLLWQRLAVLAPLWALNAAVAVHRQRPGQLSADLANYRRQCRQACTYPAALGRRVARYRRWERRLPPLLRPLAYRVRFSRQRMPVVSVSGEPPRSRLFLADYYRLNQAVDRWRPSGEYSR